jgi:hypothetical protein
LWLNVSPYLVLCKNFGKKVSSSLTDGRVWDFFCALAEVLALPNFSDLGLFDAHYQSAGS